MSLGTIFDLKQMAVFDGPGLRDTVFLKGCPLRCRWCHNPEGLDPRPQLMVSSASCIHCGRCLEVCRHPEGCVQCFACVDVCPLHLRRVSGTRITDEALAALILRDREILEQNGGGVTFSGGEPLAQAGFLFDVAARLDGLDAAIETSGYCQGEVFERMLGMFDFVIMDLKIIDPSLHRAFTGVGNAPILANLERLKRSGRPFVIRVPLIPGVSDTEENLEATARLLEGCPTLRKVELLPYHKTAGAKYKMVGLEYSPGFDTEREPAARTWIFEERGLACGTL